MALGDSGLGKFLTFRFSFCLTWPEMLLPPSFFFGFFYCLLAVLTVPVCLMPPHLASLDKGLKKHVGRGGWHPPEPWGCCLLETPSSCAHAMPALIQCVGQPWGSRCRYRNTELR